MTKANAGLRIVNIGQETKQLANKLMMPQLRGTPSLSLSLYISLSLLVGLINCSFDPYADAGNAYQSEYLLFIAGTQTHSFNYLLFTNRIWLFPMEFPFAFCLSHTRPHTVKLRSNNLHIKET